MSDTSRREFLSGAAKLAGVSAVAVAAGAMPAIALGAVREHAGTSVITTSGNAIVETSAGKVRAEERKSLLVGQASA